MRGMQRIAVVGSGISGLSAAWLLGQKYEVTLFESADYLGGHTNTVDVMLDGVTHPVDTGFLVYNTKTYPNLTAMFAQLGVASVETEMSFAVSLEEPRLEWSGSSLATVFGQKRNLLRPDFLRMLTDILRFNRESVDCLELNPHDERTLREFLAEKGYSKSFQEWYLLPMAAAIWSCPAGQMLDYPLITFLRFCRNHGLLQINDRPMWRTVRGGAREYVRRLALLIDEVRLSSPVSALRRVAGGVEIVLPRGVERFDQVVLACHSDQALKILGEHASADERALLGAVRYQYNRAVLHCDETLLPRDRSLWAAWNYLSAKGELDQRPVAVSYLLNRLQPVPFKQPVLVTLNPPREPAADKVFAEFEYAHPVFDAAAVAAQEKLAAVSGSDRVWLCGAWTGNGFHEDGLKSGLLVANALGCRAPWQGAERVEELPPLLYPGYSEAAPA